MRSSMNWDVDGHALYIEYAVSGSYTMDTYYEPGSTPEVEILSVYTNEVEIAPESWELFGLDDDEIEKVENAILKDLGRHSA